MVRGTQDQSWQAGEQAPVKDKTLVIQKSTQKILQSWQAGGQAPENITKKLSPRISSCICCLLCLSGLLGKTKLSQCLEAIQKKSRCICWYQPLLFLQAWDAVEAWVDKGHYMFVNWQLQFLGAR